MRYNNFWTIFVLLLLSLLIPFLSCLRERKNPDIPRYFPLAIGNYWEYEVTEFYVEGSDTYCFSYEGTRRFEITDKMIIAGKEFFRIDGPDVTYFIRAEDEFLLILHLYRPNDEDTIIDTLLHHQNFHGGKSWFVKGYKWESEYMPYRADYDGTEVISLPVGSFDCLKVNYTNNPDEYDCTDFYFLDDTDYHIISFWYGKDVGIVKIEAAYVDEEGDKDVCQWKLIRYGLKKR